jgi:hypothetical protein
MFLTVMNKNKQLFCRKCDSCQKIFVTDKGLKSHQALKKNAQCYRAGVWAQRKIDMQSCQAISRKYSLIRKVNNKIKANTNSLLQRHKKGQCFTSQEKTIYLNVLQYFLDKGLSNFCARIEASKACGISLRSINKVLNEKLASPTGSLKVVFSRKTN